MHECRENVFFFLGFHHFLLDRGLDEHDELPAGHDRVWEKLLIASFPFNFGCVGQNSSADIRDRDRIDDLPVLGLLDTVPVLSEDDIVREIKEDVVTYQLLELASR